MRSPDAQRGDFGSLERWTIGLLAVTVIFSILSWVPALVCLAFSRFWSTGEKLVAVLAPVVFAGAFTLLFTQVSPMQDWIRVPLMLTLSGLIPALSAVYLYTRERTPWPSSA